MGLRSREGREGNDADEPSGGIGLRGVGWRETLRHERVVFVGPPALAEGKVYLFEAAIGDVFDRCAEFWRKRGFECVEVLLEPTERCGNDHFVEGKRVTVGSSQGDRWRAMGSFSSSDRSDSAVQLKLDFDRDRFGNSIEDGFVCACKERVACNPSVGAHLMH